ncbi:MAG TPA: flagellar biosynthetic protein FliR [Polyangiales bacterium]|nr:flagellar biosynthetic protein FliR [Polyangiales bacterium]
MGAGLSAFASPAELDRALVTALLLWARLAPLFLLGPWLSLRATPSLVPFLLSVGAACALLPLALIAPATPIEIGLPLMAAGLGELARGAVLAIGCAMPFAIFESAGAWVDALRGGLVGEGASTLAKLLGFASLAVALAASVHLGVVRLFADSLIGLPLGAALPDRVALGQALFSVAGWFFRAFELGVQLAAPLLLGSFIALIVFGLWMRIGGPAFAGPALWPWLGLSLFFLSAAGMLDQVPLVVHFFHHETARVLGALH